MPRPTLAALVLAVLTACGGADEPAATPQPRAAAQPSTAAAEAARAAAARDRVDALLAAPSPATLLAALARPHAEARALRGPHRLHYTAKFDLVPEAKPRAVVGELIEEERHVADELTLVWASAAGEPVRMHIKQSVGAGEEQELVVLDEQAYTRLAHRGWQVRPLDAELHQQWLDEAQHCVHDVVELAAPALAVAVEPADAVVTVTLSKAEAADPARVAAGVGREWRQRTEITAVSGTITLDRATGLWQAADVRVGYSLRDVKDRVQRGETQLTAEVRPATAEDAVTAPDSARPVPERVRYEVERQELLGGLAGG
ncbi:MAG: hypothetical protein JNL82_02065 [Myxococcales bacterium]|nr:hypothetical protein [Myxococcales bacterium]